MKRLALLLLAVAALGTGCATRNAKPPIPSDPASATFDIATGRLVQTSNAGKSGAGIGQAVDYTDAQILQALFDHSAPAGGRSFVRTVYSNLTQPDVQRVDELSEKRKAALETAEKAFSAGLTADYDAALGEAARLGVEIVGIVKSKANKPQPDSASIIATVYSEGEGHTDVAKTALTTGGAAVAARYTNRAEYADTRTRSFEDTTTAEELKIAATVAVEIARLRAEVEKLKLAQSAPAKPPVVTPPTDPTEPPPSGGLDPANLRFQSKPEADFQRTIKFALRNTEGRDVQVSDIAGAAFSGGDLDGPTKDRDGGVRWYGDKLGSAYPSPQSFVVRLTSGSVVSFTFDPAKKDNSIAPTKVEGDDEPADPPPASEPAGGALFKAEGNTLHLRSDFAAAAGVVTAHHSINNPSKAGHDGSGASKNVSLHVNQSGNVWSVERPLADYPTGNEPNTWAIRRKPSVRYPAGVTYHIDLADTSFIRPGSTVTYPPTTR